MALLGAPRVRWYRRNSPLGAGRGHVGELIESQALAAVLLDPGPSTLREAKGGNLEALRRERAQSYGVAESRRCGRSEEGRRLAREKVGARREGGGETSWVVWAGTLGIS